jgi:hypothetical protein
MSRWPANTRKHFHRVVYAWGIGATRGWKSKVAESWFPSRRPRQRELETEQVAFNQVFARFRVKVEHRIRLLKIVRILKERYRNRRRRFGIRLQLMTGFVNWMLQHRSL